MNFAEDTIRQLVLNRDLEDMAFIRTLISGGLAEFEDAAESEVGRAAIQGFDAKLVTAVVQDAPQDALRVYVAGAHFPQPPFATTPRVTAELVIFCTTREERDAMLAALGAIRFD